ncbi:MAG: hypothetical protein ACR2P6_03015 [Gammaproteobacteria bacterium]
MIKSVEVTDDLNITPLTVFSGVILGTVVSICFGLGIVCFIFWLLQGDYPRLESEIPELQRSTAIFLMLSLVAAAGFYGSLKRTYWRHWSFAALWLALLLTGFYYWP